MRQAAAFKTARADVVVPPRIEEIVERVRALGECQDGDADLIERIYRTLIESYIAFEFVEWDR